MFESIKYMKYGKLRIKQKSLDSWSLVKKNDLIRKKGIDKVNNK